MFRETQLLERRNCFCYRLLVQISIYTFFRWHREVTEENSNFKYSSNIFRTSVFCISCIQNDPRYRKNTYVNAVISDDI